MRELTIVRAKSAAACLAKMKVYLEDPVSGDFTINGTLCRRLGELKNGETRTFPIDERAARVFVIADRLSKDFCSDWYQLPEGEENVVLSGKNRLNPLNGNAFLFDGNDNREAAAGRRRGSRIGLIVLLAAAVLGFFLGRALISGMLASRTAADKTFSSHGMTVTLTENFRETSADGYTVAFGSNKVAVLGLKEAFSLAEGFGDLSLEEYRDLVIEANQKQDAEKTTLGGIPGFRYTFTNPNNNVEYRYDAFVYKSGDAFWLLLFAAPDKDADELEAQIVAWAGTVSFSG